MTKYRCEGRRVLPLRCVTSIHGSFDGLDRMKDKDKNVPEILNTITDVVLAYRPKPKSKGAKKRKRLKNKIEKEKKPAP
jgi:hypothetical protein